MSDLLFMKIYPMFFHLLTGPFIGGGIFLGIASHLKASWSDSLGVYTPAWRKFSWGWILLFLPMLVFARKIYPWESFHGNKSIYFSHSFVIVRVVFYLTGAYVASLSFKKLPSVSLLLFCIIGSFFSIDWLMSLESGWASNLFCFIYLSNTVMVSLAIFICIKAGKVSNHVRIDLAHLLLTLALFWAYLHFSQFIIVWMANRPSEVTWYLERTGGWKTSFSAVLVGLKLLPIFFICFFRRLKSNARVLIAASLLVIVGYVLEIFWLLLPLFTNWRET